MPRSQDCILLLGLGLALGYAAGQAELIPAASADEPKTGDTAQLGGGQPTTKKGARSKGESRQAKADLVFRQKVRAAVAQELADLAALKEDFADHRHTFAAKNYGYTTLATLENCDDCVLPFLTPQAATGSSTTTTSGPK